MWTNVSRRICVGVVVAAGLTTGGAQIASAQGVCEQLWLERNQIFADAGYCFKTERAIRVFGRNCVPPYGRLSGNAQARVDNIQRQERRNGCPG
jgi:YARHG domain-containing protein